MNNEIEMINPLINPLISNVARDFQIENWWTSAMQAIKITMDQIMRIILK